MLVATGILLWIMVLVSPALCFWFEDPSTLSDADKQTRILEYYTEYAQEFPGVQDIDPQQVLDNPSAYVLVDTRSTEEQEVSGIAGAMTVKEFSKLVQGDKDFTAQKVVAFCTIGYRSAELARDMRKDHGLEVLNLRGGLLWWLHQGGTLVGPDGSSPTTTVHVYGKKWDLAPAGYTTIR